MGGKKKTSKVLLSQTLPASENTSSTDSPKIQPDLPLQNSNQQSSTENFADNDEQADETITVEKGHRGEENKAMENVTGYIGEQNKDTVDETMMGKAMSLISDASKKSKPVIKEGEKTPISKEDLELIVNELEVSKNVAEKLLRENKGNVLDTLKKFIEV
ncbi:hypothetical protein HK096_010051 [Nowakowskiella sp. JEL0078]|nr:hypothetical protein HK096_010051 [Nowakowskiella sp. JEL0078]